MISKLVVAAAFVAAASAATVMPAGATYPSQGACFVDGDCQVEDPTAKCAISTCRCTSDMDASKFCTRNSIPETLYEVNVVYSFNYPCDTFFADSLLMRKTYWAAAKVFEDLKVTSTVSSGCGSLFVAAAARVTLKDAEHLSANALETFRAALPTEAITGAILAVDVNVGSALSEKTCGAIELPVTSKVRVSSTQCMVTHCQWGFKLVQVKEHAYRAECIEDVTKEGDSDDELTEAQVSGIVIGTVLFLALLAAVGLYFATPQAVADEEEPTKEDEL